MQGNNSLLSVSSDGVSVGATQLEVTSSLGMVVNGPLETNQIQSPANQNLEIHSVSGELGLFGGRGVHIRDGPGFNGVHLTSHDDLTLMSSTGQVRG